MDNAIDTIATLRFPLLSEIPDSPSILRFLGTIPSQNPPMLTVVGSRMYSNYGKQCVDHLISGLKGTNVVIVSGLALGIDALAHEAAITNDLTTIAIPGSGLHEKVLYPRAHRNLAQRIITHGGCLLSEYDDMQSAATWTFPRRNRILAGISHATLVIEAGEKSGTLITARLATEYNRELFVVPGNIFSKNSAGSHQFLKLGAIPVTSADDIIDVLHLQKNEVVRPNALPLFEKESTEHIIISSVNEPMHKDALIRIVVQKANLSISEIQVLLMKMEMRGIITTDNDMVTVPTNLR